MADTKITALAAITTVDPAADVLPIVDISDTSMAASGTTKKITSNQILGAGGTATLASATITGALGAAGLNVTGATIPANGVYLGSANNLSFSAASALGMTLNSTGLGVGVAGGSIVARMHVKAGSFQTPLIVDTLGYYQINMQLNGVSRGQIFADATNCFAVQDSTNSFTRFSVTDSGNVGIGVTPSAWDSTFKAIQINNRGAYISATSNSFSTAPFVQIGNNGYYDTTNSRWEYVTANAAAQYVQAANSHLWYTAASGAADAEITDFATAKMTLDASGKLILGTTSPYNAARLTVQSAGGASGIAMAIQNDNDTYFAINFRNSAGTSCGSISCTTSATAFNISSDYRLKESVQPLTGGINRVNALKPSIYKWKVDGKSGEGFIAHELADVVPLAVTGEKDAVNEDGSIKPQQVDLSKIVPILVAAIQELTARVQTLEAR